MDSSFHCLRRTTIGSAFTVGSRLARSDFTLAKPGSPQAEADQRALGLLRGIRFEPVKETKPQRTGDAGRLEWGEAIFYWQTVQPPKPLPVAPVPVAPSS